jgi:hypothetical protein
MPIDIKRYPANWEELRAKVLERAQNRCEICGVENYTIGFRDKIGNFHELKSGMRLPKKYKLLKIILTTAHLDHDEENHNVSIDRLRALCQRCHLRYDIEEKKRRRKAKKANADLFIKNLTCTE